VNDPRKVPTGSILNRTVSLLANSARDCAADRGAPGRHRRVHCVTSCAGA
jgi:hypothetical protein